jgi:hypothetical protein
MPFHWQVILFIVLGCGVVGIGWDILQKRLNKADEEKKKTQ